jgi:DNA-binding transcriptional LysR family regulator
LLLFSRSATLPLPRGVEVTEDARALYPQARRMVAEADSLVRRFREDKGREPLDIGIEHDLSHQMVQAFVRLAAESLLGRLRRGCQAGDRGVAL